MDTQNYNYLLECSDVDISYEALARLNEKLQLTRQAFPEMEFIKSGPDHIPMFTCLVYFKGFKIQASAATKADAEKKVRTAMWFDIVKKEEAGNNKIPGQYISVFSYREAPNKHNSKVFKELAKNLQNTCVIDEQRPLLPNCVSCEDFETALSRLDIDHNSAMVFIDLTTIKMTDPERHSICSMNKNNIIFMVTEPRAELGDRCMVMCNEADTPATGMLHRIIYFLIDRKKVRNIVLYTDREVKILEKCLALTKHRVIVKTSLKDIPTN